MLNEKIRAQVLNGSLTDYKNHWAGHYNGYYITMSFAESVYFLYIVASAPEGMDTSALQTFLTQQQVATKTLGKFEVTDHAIRLAIKAPNLLKNLPKQINEQVEPLINYLVTSGYTSGCGNCGDLVNPSYKYEINGNYYYLCDTCAKEIESSLITNKQNAQLTKGNVGSGVIGAILGALLGGLLWVIIYNLGYIAGLAGAATIICAFKGYEMFAKHLDKRGVIISLIITAITLFFANRIAWAAVIYAEVSDLGFTFADVYVQLDDIIIALNATTEHYMDLIIGYGLTILAGFSTIKRTWKLSSGSYSMKKIK